MVESDLGERLDGLVVHGFFAFCFLLVASRYYYIDAQRPKRFQVPPFAFWNCMGVAFASSGSRTGDLKPESVFSARCAERQPARRVRRAVPVGQHR
jgi:hypothetical protein